MEKLRQEQINAKVDKESKIKTIAIFEQIIPDVKRIATAFRCDWTVKNLILQEVKQIVARAQYEEDDEQIIDENDDNEEKTDEMTVLSQARLQFYAQAWKLQAHLEQLSKSFERLQNINEPFS